MNFPSGYQHTWYRAKIDRRRIHVLAPGMPVSISEHEKQPPYLNATTDYEQCYQLLWTQGGQRSEDLIQIVEASSVSQLIERLQDGAFG